MNTPLDRRRFLQVSTTLAASTSVLSSFGGQASAFYQDDPNAIIPGKDSRLYIHSQSPAELETPIKLLREHEITPTNLIFVRNNQAIDGIHASDSPDDHWIVELDGLVEFPRSITVEDLLALEQVEQTLVLQCSGNGRAYFSKSSPAAGSQWRNGAMANVKFKGVPLKAVLEKLKANVSPAAKFVTAEGKDSPSKSGAADFEHSIPLEDAIDRSMLALRLNGNFIPFIHGGPVRLVTPGYYGTMNVKWLNRLRFETQETANHHQVKRYRTPLKPIKPGDKFDSTLENSEPNWGMRIKSVIFTPLENETVTAGNTKIDGVAWNDGTTPITAVEVSTDGGAKWHRATLKTPDSPFAWYPWNIELNLLAGEHTISSRAVDALGRTQPIDGAIHWNPAGYAWNGVQHIRIKAA